MSTKKTKSKEEDTFSLAASKGMVGALIPVSLSKSGEVIDGAHRLNQDKNWPTIDIDTVNTPLKLALARLIANTNRRMVSTKEKRIRLEEIWKEHQKEFKKPPTVTEVANWLGRSENWVYKYLPKQFKEKDKAKAGEASAEAKKSTHEREEEQKSVTRRVTETISPSSQPGSTWHAKELVIPVPSATTTATKEQEELVKAVPGAKKELQKFKLFRQIGPNEIVVKLSILHECMILDKDISVELEPVK